MCFEYLLNNLDYKGEETFIICHIGKHKVAPRINIDAIMVFNKMNANVKKEPHFDFIFIFKSFMFKSFRV